MNKQRRGEIERAIDLMGKAVDILAACQSVEEDYFEAMPANLQESLRGEQSQEAIDVLSEKLGEIEGIMDELYHIVVA